MGIPGLPVWETLKGCPLSPDSTDLAKAGSLNLSGWQAREAMSPGKK